MEKVIANTVIHRTVKPGEKGNRKEGIAAVKPTIQVIKKGTIFQTKDQAEYDDLFAAGAIRLPEKGEKVEVDIDNIVPEHNPTSETKAANKGGRKGKSEDDLV